MSIWFFLFLFYCMLKMENAGVTMAVSLQDVAVAAATAASATGKRKRSGRPVVGGGDKKDASSAASWTALLGVFQHDVKAAKTKNGLPGVPYTLKNTVAALKMVWSMYTPGVDASQTPTEWTWIVKSADAIIEKITTDVYNPGTGKLLSALSEACSMLAKRSNEEYVKNTEAPVELYTQEVCDKYAHASHACSPTALTLPDPVMKNFVSFEDLMVLRQRVADQFDGTVKTDHSENAETVRLMGWSLMIFAFSLPEDAVPDNACQPKAVKTEFLNTLCIAKGGAPIDKDVNTVAQVGEDIILTLRKATVPQARKLEGAQKAAVQFALAQRAGADHLDRLYPRRLHTDKALRRLSKGPLKDVLQGRVLTAAGLRAAWVSHHCRDVLAAVEQKLLARMGADRVDPLQVLSYGVLPKHAAAIAGLCIPPLQSKNASELVVGIQAAPGSGAPLSIDIPMEDASSEST